MTGYSLRLWIGQNVDVANLSQVSRQTVDSKKRALFFLYLPMGSQIDVPQMWLRSAVQAESIIDFVRRRLVVLNRLGYYTAIMKSIFWSLCYCVSLLLPDVLATYMLNGMDHQQQQLSAQSFAQTRNIAKPPHRTLNPASSLDPCARGHDCEHICVNSNASFYCKCRNGYILNEDKKTCSLKPKEVKVVVVVEDPCKCEARLAFQKQTQAAILQLTAKLADVTSRVEQIENMVGRA